MCRLREVRGPVAVARRASPTARAIIPWSRWAVGLSRLLDFRRVGRGLVGGLEGEAGVLWRTGRLPSSLPVGLKGEGEGEEEEEEEEEKEEEEEEKETAAAQDDASLLRSRTAAHGFWCGLGFVCLVL